MAIGDLSGDGKPDLATGKRLTGPSTLSEEQRALFGAIEVPVPTRGQLKAAV